MKERSVSNIYSIDQIVADNYQQDLNFEDSLIEMEWLLAVDVISVYDIYIYGTSSHGTAPIPNDHEQIGRSFQLEIWMRQISSELYKNNLQGLEVATYWEKIDREYQKQFKFSVKDIYYLGVLHARQSAKLQHANRHNGHKSK